MSKNLRKFYYRIMGYTSAIAESLDEANEIVQARIEAVNADPIIEVEADCYHDELYVEDDKPGEES